MTLTKVVNNNIKTNIINSNIVEYNISKAYPTILTILDHKYEYLLYLTKDQYVPEIDKIFRENKNIKKSVLDATLVFYNEFLNKNNISENNFLATTTDTILVVDKIAPFNKFEDNKIWFRNKDRITYTSLFYLSSDSYILFDRITKTIKVEGITNSKDVNSWPFVIKTLNDICCILNEYSLETRIECLKRLRSIRHRYLTSDDKSIYRCINHQNMFKYNLDGKITYSEIELKEDESCILMKDENYINFILPLIQSFV